MKISVVMPVHNDLKYLPYSLNSLRDAKIDQLVLYLDRCSKEEIKQILELVRWLRFRFFTTIVLNKKTRWKNPLAEAFEKAFSYAIGDDIFTMASDIITDTRIYSFLSSYDIISFRYKHQTLNKHVQIHNNYLNFLNRLPFVYTCKYGKWSGHFAMRKTVWKKLHYRDVTSPDLDFFNRAYEAGFSHVYSTAFNIIHLRAGTTKKKLIEQGVHRAENNYPLMKVLGHSFLELKPTVAASYLQEKIK